MGPQEAELAAAAAACVDAERATVARDRVIAGLRDRLRESEAHRARLEEVGPSSPIDHHAPNINQETERPLEVSHTDG